MLNDFKTWYFRPRDFELRDNGAVYRRLGARFYKKIVPSSGEWVSRLRGIDRLKVRDAGTRRGALLMYEEQTRKWEWGHLISAFCLQLWVCTAINLVVNVYPIMVQRYNRARIARAPSQVEPRVANLGGNLR